MTAKSNEKQKMPRAMGRRQTDRQLLHDSDVLSAVLNTAGVLIAVLNAKGEIIKFNKACETITGYSAEEAVGRHLWEVANPPEEIDQVREFFLNLIKKPFPETHERHWSDRNNQKHLIQWSNVAIKSPDGKLKYIIATGFDITEPRAYRKQLQERTAQLTERVKELRCLYGISHLSERSNMTLEEFIQGVAELIPPAWQFPELCSARVRIGDTVIMTAGFGESNICQQSNINLDGQQIGDIRVCYSQVPEESDTPFLEEEEKLLNNICNEVSHAVAVYNSRQRIMEYQQRLRSLASELALTGERERRQVAQQLHNEIGHKLASLKFKLGDAQYFTSESIQRELIQLVESTIDSTRNLTFELSPPVLHELGLGAAMEWLAHQLEINYGIACEYINDRRPKPLSEDLRVELFQAVRELLANIGKHSKASQARLEAVVNGDELQITISDNGIGFDPGRVLRSDDLNLGWGLFGIRERLAHLGAEIKITSQPSQGTTVRISATLAEQDGQPAVVTPIQPEMADTSGVSPDPIRIILADDQQLTRAGLCALLDQVPDLMVIAEAVDGEEAVALASKLKPDVVVMDVAMPKLTGIQATERILKDNPQIKVIGLSMHSDGQFVLEMLRAGATGYLLKDCAQNDLAQAIRVVRADLTFLSPGLATGVASKFVHGQPSAGDDAAPPDDSELAELTAREREVLVMIAQGFITKEIARQLAVSVKTVETHRQHIMEKLDIRTVAGLTKFAIRHRLIELHE